MIGKKIYEEELDNGFAKYKLTLPEAEYLKNIVWGGVGRRPWSETRRYIVRGNTDVPSYDEMLNYEKSIRYPTTEFHGGVRGSLPEIVQVRKLCA